MGGFNIGDSGAAGELLKLLQGADEDKSGDLGGDEITQELIDALKQMGPEGEKLAKKLEEAQGAEGEEKAGEEGGEEDTPEA